MNPLVFSALVFGLAWSLWRRSSIFLTFWVISLMVLPVARLKLAGIPIYGFDLAMLIVLFVLWRRGELSLWPVGMPRWHWWMVGAAFFLSVIGGVFHYGLLPQMVWIWGHTALAFMGFGIGVALLVATGRREYLAALQLGFLLSAAALCAIAIVQYLNLPASDLITHLFYGSIGADELSDTLRMGALSNRANGPHFSPTGFAGIVLLAAIVFFLITEPRDRMRRFLMLGLSAITILCTVSRHVLLAAVLGGLVCFVFSRGHTRMQLASVGAAMVLGLSVFAGTGLLQESWDARMSRFDDGVMNDENISARLIVGPTRLMEFFGNNPVMLLTGAGIDPEKLGSRAGSTESFGGGFVSNGFLLALYYLGIPGFLLYIGFWFWAFWSAALAGPDRRGPLLGCVTMAVVIVAADNYSLMYEPVCALLFLIVGLVAARSGDPEEMDDEEDDREDSELVAEKVHA